MVAHKPQQGPSFFFDRQGRPYAQYQRRGHQGYDLIARNGSVVYAGSAPAEEALSEIGYNGFEEALCPGDIYSLHGYYGVSPCFVIACDHATEDAMQWVLGIDEGGVFDCTVDLSLIVIHARYDR